MVASLKCFIHENHEQSKIMTFVDNVFTPKLTY